MQYEIEIKSLLGGSEKADELEQKMRQLDPDFKKLRQHTQLNHYFEGGDLSALYKAIRKYLPEDQAEQLKWIAKHSKDYSLRTRSQDKEIFLVVKASVDDTSSANGTARMEFEQRTPRLTLDQLDQLILDAGFNYQAKWSRARVEYEYKNTAVMIDKNAGYGYLAEFEKVEADPDKAEASKQELRNLMKELGAEELEQDRLARMFDFYNKHWEEYYGTDKTFVVE